MRPVSAFAILSLLLPALPVYAQMPMITPEQVGEIFCLARQGNDMNAIAGLASPALSAAIAYAEARNDVLQRASPDEKPPLGDGVPWQSYPDYASKCTVGPVTSSATASGVPITYSFDEAPDGDFTDMLVLVPIPIYPGLPAVLRIDDIGYASGSTLREALTLAFSE